MQRIGIALSLAALLAGCAGDPLKSVPRVGDVEIAEGAGQADMVAPADGADRPVTPEAEVPQRGLLGFLKRKADEGAGALPAPEVADAPVAEAEAPATTAMAEAPAAPARSVRSHPERRGRAVTQAPIRHRKRWPWSPPRPCRTRHPPKRSPVPPRNVACSGAFSTGMPAMNGPLSRPPVTGPERAGCPADRLWHTAALWRGGAALRRARAAIGQAGRWLSRAQRAVTSCMTAPPARPARRSYYLTGFKDGCARQFTAALVLFGSPESYEQIHYGPAGKSQPKAETDAAYEQVKSRDVPRRQGQALRVRHVEPVAEHGLCQRLRTLRQQSALEEHPAA